MGYNEPNLNFFSHPAEKKISVVVKLLVLDNDGQEFEVELDVATISVNFANNTVNLYMRKIGWIRLHLVNCNMNNGIWNFTVTSTTE